MQTDYYEVLGINREAEADEIKKAYRNLARQYHPDVNKEPGAEERFKQIAEAYDTLSDPEKRRNYDYRGQAESQGFSGFNPFEDFFSHFTNQQAVKPPRGADIQQILDLTFEESLFGAVKEVRYTKQGSCKTCSGTGSKDGQSKKCMRCNGVGRVTIHRRLGPITVQEAAPCVECNGQGGKVEAPCPPCKGSGLTAQETSINLTIPAGTLTGMSLNAEGHGHNAVRNLGPSGNLMVMVNVKKHQHLEPEAGTINLKHKAKLNVLYSLIGTAINIQAPDYLQNKLTTITVTVPPGTSPTKKFRIAQKGMKHIQQPTHIGDLIVEIDYTVPKVTDPEQVQKIENIIRESGL